MLKYIATFPAGCYEIIARQLKQFSLEQVKMLGHDSSSVTFDSSLKFERLIEFRFFTNVFMVLDESKLATYRPFIRGSSFRLIALVNGEPSRLDDSKKNALVADIEQQLTLQANTAKQSVDFILMKRAGQPEILTLRLPRPKHKRENLPKGSLRPELAHILLLTAGVKAKHKLLDPFAGHGSILFEAQRGFGVKNIVAVDNDPDLVKQLISSGFQVVEDDAIRLESIPDASVDRIATDPPWGIYNKTIGSQGFYNQSLSAIHRVLKPRGVAVILSGSESLDQAIRDSQNFARLKVYNILVSGKKANIFKLQKKG